jgi:hypothetical protein
MPLSNPDDYRDKTADWLEVFHRQRRAVMSEIVTPEVLEQQRTLSEPETTLRHAHLHLMMNYVRLAPAVGKSFVYAEKPYERYRVGFVTERGQPTTLLDKEIYSSEGDARQAVLLRRLEAMGIDTSGASS